MEMDSPYDSHSRGVQFTAERCASVHDLCGQRTPREYSRIGSLHLSNVASIGWNNAAQTLSI